MNDLRLITGVLGWLWKAGRLCLVAAVALRLAGCSTKTLDPTQIGRFRPTPAVNVILDSLGVAEEVAPAWSNAEEPQPKDIVAVRGDYMLRSGDLVRVSIFELYLDSQTVTNDYIISETGKISIPVVGVVQAAGLTETQLQEEIRQILSPNILKDPSITVTLLNSQQRTFSILGNGVPQPGRFPIPRYDFRLTDALAMAGGPDQFNVSNIYVSRAEDTAMPAAPGQRPWQELELITPESSPGRSQSRPSAPRPTGSAASTRTQEIPEPSQPAERFELEREMLDLIAPSAQSPWPATDKVVASAALKETEKEAFKIDVAPPAERAAALAREQDIVASVMPPPGFRLLTKPKTAEVPRPNPNEIVQTMAEFGDANQVPTDSAAADESEQIEWVFRDGQWVPVSVGPGAAEPTGRELPPSARELPALPMEEEWAEAIQTRLIKVPADKLLSGDPRYNVIIKPGDTVHVPVDLVGEFWITGNVVRSGVINMTGRPMNLKQAIAAAGGLGPLAYPKYCEVIRRIGEKKEEIVMVDLDKIASGEQPDFFIKPHDLINVGTHPTSRWRAVLRSAFRAAYGFAFVYDRNFADADYGDGFRLPSWL